MCRLPASCLLCVCDRDVECVCATLLRPIWRALNLYRFPFPGLCFPSLELRHAAMQPPPSSPCNTISPINSSPFKTHNRMTNKRTLCALCCRAPRQNSQTVTLKIGEVLVAPLFLWWRRISSMRRLKVHRRLTFFFSTHYASHTHTVPSCTHCSHQVDLIIQNNEILIEIRLATESSSLHLHPLLS